MYTSGTTGDPKGVLISNESIIALLAGVKRLLESVNEKVIFFSNFCISYLYAWLYRESLKCMFFFFYFSVFLLTFHWCFLNGLSGYNVWGMIIQFWYCDCQFSVILSLPCPTPLFFLLCSWLKRMYTFHIFLLHISLIGSLRSYLYGMVPP